MDTNRKGISGNQRQTVSTESKGTIKYYINNILHNNMHVLSGFVVALSPAWVHYYHKHKWVSVTKVENETFVEALKIVHNLQML